MRVCWAQWVFLAIVAFMGLTQMLTACGNKGPLYLPTEAEIAELERKKIQSPANPTTSEDELDRLDAQAEKDAKKNKAE